MRSRKSVFVVVAICFAAIVVLCVKHLSHEPEGPARLSASPTGLAASASAVIVYGCGVSNYLTLKPTETRSLSMVLEELEPLPEAVNGLFLIERGRHILVQLPLDWPGNRFGARAISNGTIIVLTHINHQGVGHY